MSIRPFRNIKRKKTKVIKVGKLKIGGDNPISVQSMTNTLTTDIEGTIKQINAIEEAAAKTGSWNLEGASIYVNLEPCSMCAGAILQAHIKKVVFSAFDSKSGAFGSRHNLATKNMEIIGGILEEESLLLLRGFFEGKRI